MNKQFLTGQVKQLDIESRSLTAYASTEDWDRDGEVILASAWEGSLDTFRANAVLLWAHDYRIPPVGKVTDIRTDSKGLRFTAEFAKTEFGEEIWSLYRDEFLSAFSVGFQPEEWDDLDDGDKAASGRIYTRTSLMEISCVPVPANASCLVERGVPVFQFKSVDEFTQPVLADNPHLPKEFKDRMEALAGTPSEPESAEIKDDSAVELPDSATTTVTSGYVSVDDNGTAVNPWITVTSTNGDLIYHVPNKDHESDLQPDPVSTEPPADVTEPPNAVTEADDANDYAEPDPADDALLEALSHFVDEIRELLT